MAIETRIGLIQDPLYCTYIGCTAWAVRDDRCPDHHLDMCCRHGREPHMVWFWYDDPSDPIPAPYSIRVDDHLDAVEVMDRFIDNKKVSWAKAFRSGNEHYTCLRYNAPEQESAA